MSKRVVTAEDIIAGARKQARPRIRFPGLSNDLNAQASLASYDARVVRRGASPFVRDTLARVRSHR